MRVNVGDQQQSLSNAVEGAQKQPLSDVGANASFNEKLHHRGH